MQRQLFQSEIVGSRPKKKHGEILDIYRDPPQLLEFYEDWLAFCRSAGKIGAHMVVEYDTAPRIHSPDEWRMSAGNNASPQLAVMG